ncbi:Mor transcription activator family protein [Isobaculum melis]|uniref:Mor transcription activator family protein n=1 Tax=Isobaculum melis TaxID=142588 RepID=A0A1H9RMD5_9LACT|nr:Mor transcription activator family protein [Isobaculum melis]SER73807.1 Mor transcription activator family protein [Isobaculum melis]
MEIDTECLVKSYKEFYELLGEENLMKIYDAFKGQQITFPMKMYDKKLVAEKVKKEFKEHNVSDLTRRYGYSQRWLKETCRVNETKKSIQK